MRHKFELPSIGAWLHQCELRGPDLLVLRTRQHGGVMDERASLVFTDKVTRWSSVRLVLEGASVARGKFPLELNPGDGLVGGAYFAAPTRSLSPTSDWLTLAWRSDSPVGGRIGDSGRFRFTATARHGLAALADCMAFGTEEDARRALGHVIECLRTEGAPFERDAWRLPEQGVSAKSREFARVLERALRLPSQPMAVDLAKALGVGERQALRRATEHFRRFHVSVSSWREYVAGIRISVGATFMGAGKATTEEVSRYLGFASPTGLCHAFQDAGLPSPHALQRELRH